MGILVSTLYRMRHLRPILNFKGLQVPVTGDHISRSVWKHVWKGSYEKPEIEAAIALSRPGDTVLELGTGMGIVSATLHANVSDLNIHSFEANPNLIEPINNLHKLNGISDIIVKNEVLLPNPDESHVELNLHADFPESSILTSQESGTTATVPTRDLNAVLKELSPDIFICDIEGAEEFLFSNGLSLTGLRALIIELHPEIISRGAIKNIYDICGAAGLYPVMDLCDKQVIAFEHVPQNTGS